MIGDGRRTPARYAVPGPAAGLLSIFYAMNEMRTAVRIRCGEPKRHTGGVKNELVTDSV
jgi:hypothetical protein